MLSPRRLLFLHLSVGSSTIAFSTAVAQSAEPHLLSSCSHCWPLSGVHPNSLMAPDEAGGTYVVWVDGSFRWRLQRLRADLTILKPWPVAGLSLTTERQSSRIYPVLAADGSGGVYVAWAEQATNGDMSVWLLRLRPDGRAARGWPDGGVVLTGPSPMVTYPALVRSGNGAAVAWLEARNGRPWIRLAALDANGRALAHWPQDEPGAGAHRNEGIKAIPAIQSIQRFTTATSFHDLATVAPATGSRGIVRALAVVNLESLVARARNAWTR